MTGEEYQNAIDRLDLSQMDAAKFLGVNERTSRRWVLDENPIPKSVTMLLRAMIKYKLTPKQVEALRALR